MLSSSILPAIATATLAAALAMPLRDGSRGRRGASAGAEALEVRFRSNFEAHEPTDDVAVECEGEPERAFRAILEERLAAREERAGAPCGAEVISPHDTVTRARAERYPLTNVASYAVGTTRLARFLRYLFPERSVDLETRRPMDDDVASGAERTALEPFTLSNLEHPAATHDSCAEASGDAGDDAASAVVPLDRAAMDAEAPAETALAAFDAPATEVPSHGVPPRAIPLPTERVVPLTRRRLRAGADRFTWPEAFDPPAAFESDERRRAFLAEICATPRPEHANALERAFAEEPYEYRRAALGALVRLASPSSADAFITALRTGEDDERVAALDGLIRLGRFEELPIAFEDRCDAIAAKGALAFIPERERAAFAGRLAEYVDPCRCERIVALLAGVLR